MQPQIQARAPRRSIHVLACAAALVLLAGCGDRTDDAGLVEDSDPAEAALLTESDVEAPEVFRVEDSALWDGRPSLGGIWVAAPGVTDPERVVLRNAANGTSVVGALFKRERDNPGPALQLSSEAAAALGILAGAPTRIEVVALRRAVLPDAAEAPPPDAPQPVAQVSTRSRPDLPGPAARVAAGAG